MDWNQFLATALGQSPVALVLIWMLIREQKQAEQARLETTETRKARDDDNRMWVERFAVLVDRVTKAVERLDLPGPN